MSDDKIGFSKRVWVAVPRLRDEKFVSLETTIRGLVCDESEDYRIYERKLNRRSCYCERSRATVHPTKELCDSFVIYMNERLSNMDKISLLGK